MQASQFKLNAQANKLKNHHYGLEELEHVPANENSKINKLSIPQYFHSMTVLNNFKQDEVYFNNLIDAIQTKNKDKVKTCLNQLCRNDFETTFKIVKSIIQLHSKEEQPIKYASKDIFYSLSLIFEVFGKYQEADQLFERSISLDGEVKDLGTLEIKEEHLQKCGRFKPIFKKNDTFNPALIKLTLVDRISHQYYSQYKIQNGENYLAVTEPYLRKESQASSAHSAVREVLGIGYCYAVFQRRNKVSGLAIKGLGSIKEVCFPEITILQANQLYCKIKNSNFAKNLNFPVWNHKGALQRAVKGINFEHFLELPQKDRLKFMSDNLISLTIIKQFQMALSFLNKEVKYVHQNFHPGNIMLDYENKCLTLIGFDFTHSTLDLRMLPKNIFPYDPADFGFEGSRYAVLG